jgi:hypothetical protein
MKNYLIFILSLFIFCNFHTDHKDEAITLSICPDPDTIDYDTTIIYYDSSTGLSSMKHIVFDIIGEPCWSDDKCDTLQIYYTVSAPCIVSVSIINIKEEEIQSLVNGFCNNKGLYFLAWPVNNNDEILGANIETNNRFKQYWFFNKKLE